MPVRLGLMKAVIDRLIKKLEVDKEILAEPDEDDIDDIA